LKQPLVNKCQSHGNHQSQVSVNNFYPAEDPEGSTDIQYSVHICGSPYMWQSHVYVENEPYSTSVQNELTVPIKATVHECQHYLLLVWAVTPMKVLWPRRVT